MIWKYTDIRTFSETEYKIAYEMTDPHKKARLAKTRQRKDRWRTVIADSMARGMLAELLGCRAEEVVFAYEENGRPYLPGSPYRFNISHSENVVAVAVHTKDVGIDVEKIRDVSMHVAKKYFCADENMYLFGHEPQDADFAAVAAPDVLLRFFEIWTAKEAYLKSMGRGLTHLRAVNTVPLSFERHLLEEDYLLTIYTKKE